MIPSTWLIWGCGPGNLTDNAGPALAGRGGARRGQLAVHDRGRDQATGGAAPADSRSNSATSGTGARPARLDVIVCNAVLQWVPGHQGAAAELGGSAGAGRLAGLPAARQLRPASHAIVSELAASPRWRAAAVGRELNRQAGRPGRLRGTARPAGLLGSTPGRPATCTSCPGPTRCSSGRRARRCGRCWRPWTRSRRRRSRRVRGAPAAGVPAAPVRHGLPLPPRVHRGAPPDGLTSVRFDSHPYLTIPIELVENWCHDHLVRTIITEREFTLPGRSPRGSWPPRCSG